MRFTWLPVAIALFSSPALAIEIDWPYLSGLVAAGGCAIAVEKAVPEGWAVAAIGGHFGCEWVVEKLKQRYQLETKWPPVSCFGSLGCSCLSSVECKAPSVAFNADSKFFWDNWDNTNKRLGPLSDKMLEVGVWMERNPTGGTLPARADTPATVIDWSQGYVQDTKASCGNITLKNLPERHTTSLWVRGTPGVCSFAADGLTFHMMPADSGATAQGTTTLFVFQRIGSDVLVTDWPR
jgi:hypothetical protein